MFSQQLASLVIHTVGGSSGGGEERGAEEGEESMSRQKRLVVQFSVIEKVGRNRARSCAREGPGI